MRNFFDFKTLVRCATYDDEVWYYAKQALTYGTADDQVIAQKILSDHLDVEEAQALLN